jgi:large subunit ribosomal protein L31
VALWRPSDRRLASQLASGLKYRSSLPKISGAAMKADIHPEYRDVVFQDVTSDFKILSRSTLSSKETVKWEDGNEYPLIKLDISSASHPFYTGQHKVMDTGGRIDKFQKRYQQK